MHKLALLILSLMVTSIQAQDNSNLLTTKSTAKNTDNVSPHEAAVMLDDKKTIIIDVREEYEWREQHILGALHIPLAQLGNRLAELAPYKNTPIITQCQRGGRSKNALAVLKAAGFSRVYNLEGGLTAWDDAGLKTE